MASFNTTGLRYFLNGATAISAFTRVAINSSGILQCASATGGYIGVLDLDAAANDWAAVRMPTCPGSRKYIADTAITAWGYVYASPSGYATSPAGTASFSANAITLGYAAAPSGQTVAATALGSVFEVVPHTGGI